MGKAPPAFQFYADAFDQGTADLTLAEEGAYIRLLCSQWAKGSVPGDNMKRLAGIMRCTPATAKTIWTVIADKFDRGEDGGWRNARLERVRDQQNAFKAGKSRAGKAGAEKRWQKDGTAMAEPLAKPMAKRRQDDSSLISDLKRSSEEESKNASSSETSAHPIKAFLGRHDALFTTLYGAKPTKYTSRDAKHAKDVIADHGEARALELLEQFFRSRDPFIAGSGHALGVFVTVQNKLIAELSGRKPAGDNLDGLREFARG